MSVDREIGWQDEPQQSGAVVAVRYGDYRDQELFVRSGANIGCWCPLGNEFGVPRGLPLHPHWEDVLARGPVTLLTAADEEAYATGWANGRRRLAQQVEELSDAEAPTINNTQEAGMGWASAGAIFDPVAKAMVELGAPDDMKIRVLGDLIGALRDGDWDTEHESLEEFQDDPAIVEAFRRHDVIITCDDEHELQRGGAAWCTGERGHDGVHADDDGREWA